MKFNKETTKAIDDVHRLRKVLKTGRDDEGRRLTDPIGMLDCIKDAEQKVGKLIIQYYT